MDSERVLRARTAARALWGRLSALGAMLLAFAAGAGAHEVDIVFSDRHRPHVETVRAVQQTLRAEDVRLFEALENGDITEESEALKQVVARKPDLIVLVGDDALRAALAMQVRIPMVSLMAVRLHPGLAADILLTGVDLRPDPREVASELLRLAPADASVLTYFSPDLSGDYIREAGQAFRERSMRLSAQVWPEQDVVAVLNREIAAYDIYWMQLEERSARPDMLRLLFSVAARQAKGLVGLSEKYVRAGAMIAWTPQPEAVGYQGGELANRVLDGKSPRSMPIEHARHMKISINHDFRLRGDVDMTSMLKDQ